MSSKRLILTLLSCMALLSGFHFVVISSVIPHEGAKAPEAGMVGMANPAAVYCLEMGYEYQIADGPSGQRGICIFPDGSRCDAWDFLEGKCGQEYSYCAIHGYDLQTRTDGKDAFSREYAVCVSRQGTEIGSVTELFDLREKVGAQSVPPGMLRDEETGAKSSSNIKAPPSFDWRSYNGHDWMTAVKNQGSCGSCWGFGAVGAVEAMYNFRENDYDLDLDLSEQYLVSDCHNYAGYQNCCGGYAYKAFEFIRDEGIPDEDCMPYVDISGCTCYPDTCKDDCNYKTAGACSDVTCSDRCPDWLDRLVSIDEYGTVPSDIETIKSLLIEKGPLTAGMRMSGYWDGDIYRCDPDAPGNHYVVIAGYDDAGGYWIIKNSYGPGFQEDGYFKVGYGECSIEQWVYYADKEMTCGDVKADQQVDIGDLVYLTNYLYKEGPEPECGPITACGDVNLDATVDIADVVYLVNYLYRNGTQPCSPVLGS